MYESGLQNGSLGRIMRHRPSKAMQNGSFQYIVSESPEGGQLYPPTLVRIAAYPADTTSESINFRLLYSLKIRINKEGSSSCGSSYCMFGCPGVSLRFQLSKRAFKFMFVCDLQIPP